MTSDATMTALLSVAGLTKDYIVGDLVTPVLKGISFDIYTGEFVAMLGPSGSGKSTLLSILGTLLKPTAGHFFMLGNDLTKVGERELTKFRNRNIGFVFQYHHLLPDFSALENVMFPAVASGLMVARPACVLADEPTGNLDRESAHQVMELLTEINAESGTTFLISTHDSEIASRCQRKITIIDGKVDSIETNPVVQHGLAAA